MTKEEMIKMLEEYISNYPLGQLGWEISRNTIMAIELLAKLKGFIQ